MRPAERGDTSFTAWAKRRHGDRLFVVREQAGFNPVEAQRIIETCTWTMVMECYVDARSIEPGIGYKIKS